MAGESEGRAWLWYDLRISNVCGGDIVKMIQT